MADTSFTDTTTTTAGTTIVAAWLNDVDKHVYWGRNVIFATTAGTANAQTLTLPATSLYSAYSGGDRFMFKAGAGLTNTTTCTLQVIGASTLPAKTIKNLDGSNLVASQITAARVYDVVYEATADCFYLLSGIAILNDVAVDTLSATDVTLTNLINASGFYVPVTGGIGKNAIINGDFRIAQRGTSYTAASGFVNNDAAMVLDRWVLLSDGNDIVDVTREATTVPTNGLYAIALDVETINKKFGILQIIRQKNCKGYIGNTCTLSFKAKVSATTKLDNVKAAIVSWDGTADSPTRDIVSAWNVEGTNPTLVANWTYENSPTNLSLTTSYATYSVSAAVDTASAKNIGVFIWSDVTDTTLGDFLYLTDVMFEKGSVATEFERVEDSVVIRQCEAEFQKSFELDTAPAQNIGGGTGDYNVAAIRAGAATNFIYVTLRTRMSTAPSITTYNPAAANAEMRDGTAAADCSSTTAANISQSGFRIDTTGNASTAVANRLSVHWSANAEM